MKYTIEKNIAMTSPNLPSKYYRREPKDKYKIPVSSQSTTTTICCRVKGIQIEEDCIEYVLDTGEGKLILAKIDEGLLQDSMLSIGSRIKAEVIETIERNKKTNEFVARRCKVSSLSLVV